MSSWKAEADETAAAFVLNLREIYCELVVKLQVAPPCGGRGESVVACCSVCVCVFVPDWCGGMWEMYSREVLYELYTYC